jgi:pimeloyl-ACP methyl ester carboxylesterase
MLDSRAPLTPEFWLVRAFIIICALASTFGCASPAQRIDAEAERAGLTREIARGTAFRHVVYTRGSESSDATWTIYLEGDGLPWLDGRTPASDPTTRDPLALHLMLQSSGPAMYVTRPCYHELLDAGCSWRAWTLERYSPAIVDSMVQAIAQRLHDANAERVRVVGYSGGGALAVLIAERLPNVVAVVTIAANLDIDAWSRHHGYLPLEGSMNPARSTLAHPWSETHVHGRDDIVVPLATTRAYFERYPAARQITLDSYDHVCCWVRDWAAVQGLIAPRAESAVSGKSLNTPSIPSSKN